MEADFAAERAARGELMAERLAGRVAELEATETRLRDAASAAEQKRRSWQAEAGRLNAELDARSRALAASASQFEASERTLADVRERGARAEAEAAAARTELEALRADADAKASARRDAEAALASAEARARDAVAARDVSEGRLGVAANVLRRLAAKMGGAPTEAWTPARIEQTLLDRLDAPARAAASARAGGGAGKRRRGGARVGARCVRTRGDGAGRGRRRARGGPRGGHRARRRRGGVRRGLRGGARRRGEGPDGRAPRRVAGRARADAEAAEAGGARRIGTPRGRGY